MTSARGAVQVLRQLAPGEVLDLGQVFRGPLGLSRLNREPRKILGRREAVLLGMFAIMLHVAVIYWVNQSPPPALPVVPPEIPPMTIEFSQPAPPLVETPPPPPEPVAKPVEQPPTPPAQPQPPAAPAPPAPPAPKPVTQASASAGYLKNPAPEYPAIAMRRGWEGTVLLRVHVLASGKPGEIQIQKSSGRGQLDDAAQAAVKRWSFVPAKQGDVAQDGWVSVPIDFKIR